MSDGISKMYETIQDIEYEVNEIVINKLGFNEFKYSTRDTDLYSKKPLIVCIENNHWIVFNSTFNGRLVTSGESKIVGEWKYYVSE